MPFEVVGRRAPETRAALGVDRVQALAEREVILGLEARPKLQGTSPRIQTFADGHAVENEVRQEARGGRPRRQRCWRRPWRPSPARRALSLELSGSPDALLEARPTDLRPPWVARVRKLAGPRSMASISITSSTRCQHSSRARWGGAGVWVFAAGHAHQSSGSHPMPGGRAVSPTAPTVNSTQQVRVIHKTTTMRSSKP